MSSLKGLHYPKEVVLYALYLAVRYDLSYRDIEEIMNDRGVSVDHSTINRWVIRYAPLIAAPAKKFKRPGGCS